MQELGYRNLLDIGKEDVLQDTLNAAMNISTKGLLNIEEFQLYLNGITRIRGFIHSETYSLESHLELHGEECRMVGDGIIARYF